MALLPKLCRENLLKAWLAALLLQTFGTVSCEAAPAATAGKSSALEDVTVLHQKTVALGKCDLYLTDHSMHFFARKNDIQAVASAPDWKVMLFCKSKNSVFTMTAKETSLTSLGIFTSPISIFTGKSTAFVDSNLHIKCLKIYCPGGKTILSRDSFVFQERSKKSVLDTTVIAGDFFKLPKPLQDTLYWLYNFKTFPGVPIDLTTRFSDGSKENIYHTTSVEHVQEPASFFAYPDGYKKVDNKMLILVSDDYSTTLEDLWGGAKK